MFLLAVDEVALEYTVFGNNVDPRVTPIKSVNTAITTTNKNGIFLFKKLSDFTVSLTEIPHGCRSLKQ